MDIDFSGLQLLAGSLILIFKVSKNCDIRILCRERCKKKLKKKLTNVSFMYVCVAGNGEMLVFFLVFSPNNSLIDNSLSE